MFRTLKDPSMGLLQTWQILDWPFTPVFGLTTDGMLMSNVFFCVPVQCYLSGSVIILFLFYFHYIGTA